MANYQGTVLDARFGALAHATRRHVVEVLSRKPCSASEAMRGLDIAKPTATRHLQVLERAGLITRVVHGREHRLDLVREHFVAPAGWLQHQALWERHFDIVEAYLREERADD